ncbi:MAG TPA: ArsR family transcriptional regulator [Ktedonobacterales bacterium]
MPDTGTTGGGWDQRFLGSTRGQLIVLLRRGPRTVEELAAAVGLTDNAVRAHLAALERDGMARVLGVRRGGGSGKPAYEYVLTPAAERVFPKPYADMLGTLYDVLGERLPATELETLARETGRRMARRLEVGGNGDGGERTCRHGAEGAVAALNAMGGLAELEVCDQSGARTIHAHTCPLAEVVTRHPGACALAQEFVSGLAGVPVRAECSLDERPHCRFTLREDSLAHEDERN